MERNLFATESLKVARYSSSRPKITDENYTDPCVNRAQVNYDGF